MKSQMMSRVSVFVVLCYCIFIPINAIGATIAHWNFEDGVAGQPFTPSGEPTGSGGSYDLISNILMRGDDPTDGPSFTDITPTGSGLGAYCNGDQNGYTTDSNINTWSPEVWTIEISARLDDVSGWETLIGRNGSSYGDSEADFYLQRNDANGAFRLNYETVTGQRWICDSDFTVQSGQWYHLAVTSDGVTLTMYCDKLDGAGYQVVSSLDISSQTPAENALATFGQNWTFGRGWFNGNAVDHITGYFDNVRFSDTVLTPDEFLGVNPVLITETEGKTVLFLDDIVYTDDYSVVLNKQPNDDVTVTVLPPSGLTVGNGGGQSLDLTFTDQNWDQPQTVTVQIADPDPLTAMELIHHTVQSNDSNYNGVFVRDVKVYIEEDICGFWGYLEGDYNMDCVINLEDFARFGSLWLVTEAPVKIQEIAVDWLENTLVYDSELYDRSIQKSDQPFFIDTAIVENTIDEKVYGHFLEHIYHSANGGLWGDLIWNRSFELDAASGGAVWTIEGDELVQSSMSTDVHMEFGDTAWTNYELTLQAKKDGGNEGFLIIVRAPDSNNFYWINIGGWGNTQHAIEKETGGSRSVVTPYVTGGVATDQWYDIRVRCEGNNIQVWMDEDNDPNPDPQIFDYTDTNSPHLSGNVGVGTWQTQARYRNIRVTDLSGSTVLYEGLPTLPPVEFGSRNWAVYGNGDASIVTDALNDNYSVQIVSDGSAAGLQQNDFKFTQQPYHGSLWMKGSMPAGVRVEFMDDSTVLGQAILAPPTSNWEEYPFSITPVSSADNGSLRISPLGAGTVLIDQVSMMGQDAIDTGGYRPDLLQAVADLRPPVIRWPGGCFASLYLWKDGIGPQHERRQYPAYMWDDQDTNSFGTDEFIQMCHAIGAEPLICINTGILDGACGAPAQWKLSPDTTETYIQDALDWMEYCNGDPDTTYWGGIRAANGHPEPYNVIYWEIDNETWSESWGGGITNYIAVVQAFAPELQAKADELGVPIEISAVGGGSYDMSWNQALIDACAPLIDYISVHHYEGSGGYKSGPQAYDNFLTTLANSIANSDNPNMKIYNSEWNLQTTDWRTGLYAGGILNVYEKHGADFKIGGPALFLRHTSASGWDNAFINFDHTGWFPAPNYVVMKLWHDHYAPNRVQTTGIDTNLNVVSTLSDDAETLYIQIVNPDDVDKSVEFEVDGSFIPETAYIHYVAPGDLLARNTLENPNAVHVQAKVVGMDNQVLRFIMPAYSAGVVTVETAPATQD